MYERFLSFELDLIALNLTRTPGLAILIEETVSLGMTFTEGAVPKVGFGIEMLTNHGF
jgi:hypothetical protein